MITKSTIENISLTDNINALNSTRDAVRFYWIKDSTPSAAWTQIADLMIDDMKTNFFAEFTSLFYFRSSLCNSLVCNYVRTKVESGVNQIKVEEIEQSIEQIWNQSISSITNDIISFYPWSSDEFIEQTYARVYNGLLEEHEEAKNIINSLFINFIAGHLFLEDLFLLNFPALLLLRLKHSSFYFQF